MSTHPTDHQMIGFAMYLLHDGILASAIPNWLMTEFGLTPERAKELTDKAIELHEKQGRRAKLHTKPLDEPGE